MLKKIFFTDVNSSNNSVTTSQSKGGNAFLGGPKVHFGGEEEHERLLDEGGPSNAQVPGTSESAAQFERKNTPHPKMPSAAGGQGVGTNNQQKMKHSHQPKHNKAVDGHVAQRMEEVVFC